MEVGGDDWRGGFEDMVDGAFAEGCRVAPERRPVCRGGAALIGCVRPIQCFELRKQQDRESVAVPGSRVYVAYPAAIEVTDEYGDRTRVMYSLYDETIHVDPVVQRVIRVPRGEM